MSGHPQGGHYDNSYDHNGQGYYHDDQGYYDQNQHYDQRGEQPYYDEQYASVNRRFTTSKFC